MGYDVRLVRKDFPFLSQETNGNPVVFLDSAASAQKPVQVIDTVRSHYETGYANVHRGLYDLSEKATLHYEQAREKVQKFINASSSKEIVFTKGATQALNLIAYSYGADILKQGDEIIISRAEHHSNIVPWQILQKRIGFKIKIAEVRGDGSFDLDYFKTLLSDRTKLVCATQMSNVLGSVFPAKEICALSRQAGAGTVIDGSQAVTHFKTDVQDIGCDFYVFSGHKLYGPTGIGVLYAKLDVQEKMPPFEGGGDMVKNVSFEETTFAEPPARFEAGTPPFVQAVGLGAAIDYLSKIGMEAVFAHDKVLCRKLMEGIASIQGTRQIGTAENKGGLVSFVMDGVHPQDMSTLLNQYGVCVRAGHHCAQPLHERFGVSASVRASSGIYTTEEEIDFFIQTLHKVKKFF